LRIRPQAAYLLDHKFLEREKAQASCSVEVLSGQTGNTKSLEKSEILEGRRG